jgi:hypothetical protein
MMKKTGLKKITLSKETLRILEDVKTLNAGGGIYPESGGYCSGSCAGPVCSVASCPTCG